ncbi:hypothetical protein [Nostoc sp.]|uniref:hypothetical protein n=1 Tax=Nostoc sp. TaxID=1180 RepID=UPI002FF67DFB
MEFSFPFALFPFPYLHPYKSVKGIFPNDPRLFSAIAGFKNNGLIGSSRLLAEVG